MIKVSTIRTSQNRPVRRRAICGFTLVEIMVVVTLISLIIMLSVPTMQKIRRKARAATIANDFRVFATAFATYSQENGAWPAEAAAGVTPTGMAPYLRGVSWPRVTPMGGHYNWENSQLHQGGFRPRAAIAISSTSDSAVLVDANQLMAIDEAIDDGDLTTGNFRVGAGNAPLYVIEN